MPRSIPIKNLAEFMPTYHAYHPDTVGLVRVVSEVHTNGFYSKVKDQPEHPLSMSNHGKGFFTPFEKASNYHYGDSSIDCLNSKTGEVIYTFEIYGIQNQEREEKNMNEWARLERQAERYKKDYPEGTRIMLLSIHKLKMSTNVYHEKRDIFRRKSKACLSIKNRPNPHYY